MIAVADGALTTKIVLLAEVLVDTASVATDRPEKDADAEGTFGTIVGVSVDSVTVEDVAGVVNVDCEGLKMVR